MNNFTDHDFLVLNKLVNEEGASDDELAEVKQKLAYNAELIKLRQEFMNRAEEIDKKYIKKDEDK